MDGTEALRIIAEARTDQVVITHMSSAREWPQVSSREELDLPLMQCMGKASSLGLGVALACPQRRVIVLDGDGSLLTNLGSLVTIAAAGVPNLLHVVLENGTYDTTGGQPVPNSGHVDFAGLALEAGYRGAYEFESATELAEALPAILLEEGPILVCVKVAPGWATSPFPKRLTVAAFKEVAESLARGA
jgi:sulfopyruvate decarboxylase subunit beta